MTAADRTAPRASGGVLFRLWLAASADQAGAGAAPDRAPAGLGREDAEAVIGACTTTRGAAFGPPFLFVGLCDSPLSAAAERRWLICRAFQFLPSS
jgi:hypothetical protein